VEQFGVYGECCIWYCFGMREFVDFCVVCYLRVVIDCIGDVYCFVVGF